MSSQSAIPGTFLPDGLGFTADPFDDLAGRSLPRTIPDALRWSQAIHVVDGTYAQAMRRVVSYFLTDLEISSARKSTKARLSSEEREKYAGVLEAVGLRAESFWAGYDYLVYGVSFVSVIVPFRRYLICDAKRGDKSCGYMSPLEKVMDYEAYDFAWEDFAFVATCPACKCRGKWRRYDERGNVENDALLTRWNPFEMAIAEEPVSRRRRFIWKIPEYYRRAVRNGDPLYLLHTNWEVIEAVKDGKNIRFDDGIIHYSCEPAMAGIYTGGWGLSRTVIHYRQAFHRQMLRRLNEAVCQEFLVPLRILSPAGRSGAEPGMADPIFNGGGGMFQSQMRAAYARNRRNPGEVLISPYPVNYQLAGGEANQLAPVELINQAEDAQLNASGVPAELYRGTLTLQMAAVMMRLFESQWPHYVAMQDARAQFVADRVSKILKWEPVTVRWKKPRIADDANKQMALLQLMMSKQVSQTTALEPFGLAFKQEQEQLVDEQQYVGELTAEMQQEQATKQQQQALTPPAQPAPYGQPPGQPQPQPGQPPQGQPPGPQGNSPEEILAKADQIAQQFQEMDPTQQRSELIQLGKSDEVLHALVKSRLEQDRTRTNTAGGAQLRAQRQQQGQQGQQQGPPA